MMGHKRRRWRRHVLALAASLLAVVFILFDNFGDRLSGEESCMFKA